VIGTLSESENLALFAISPSVAMRTVWLSAEVVTPRSAARSNRGLMVISGGPDRRHARRAQLGSLHFVGDLVTDSEHRSSPPRYSIMSR
jgi:hypothetical protein